MFSARESINEEQRVGIELVNAFLFVFHALIERKMEEYVSSSKIKILNVSLDLVIQFFEMNRTINLRLGLISFEMSLDF